MVQTFAKALVDNGINSGSFVNIASIIGKIGNIGQTNYAASKAGVELLTKSAAKEFGKFGFRCNSVLPGLIETPMTETIPDKVKQKLLATIPFNRYGKPEGILLHFNFKNHVILKIGSPTNLSFFLITFCIFMLSHW